VVVGIIAILIAILLPALARARQEAQKVACGSNLRQCGMAILNYANENKGWLYPHCDYFSTLPPNYGNSHDSWFDPSSFASNPAWGFRWVDWAGTVLITNYTYDLRTAYKPYMKDMNAWRCAALPNGAAIDAKSEVASGAWGILYCTYDYFPGRQLPNFSAYNFNNPTAGIAHVNPIQLSQLNGRSSANVVMMQDRLGVSLNISNFVFANHCRGGSGGEITKSNNQAFVEAHTNSYSNVLGANILFYDGHVEWLRKSDYYPPSNFQVNSWSLTPFDGLQPVGLTDWGNGTGLVGNLSVTFSVYRN
jgi:prepilin-type processing-associated H-X9-DG protein